MRTLILTLLFCAVSMAQTTTRAAVISISDANNPPETAYNIYRALGSCAVATPDAFVKIASGVVNKIYRDATVGVGNYCYKATAVLNGIEGEPSNTAAAVVGPMKFTITVSVEQTVSNP